MKKKLLIFLAATTLLLGSCGKDYYSGIYDKAKEAAGSSAAGSYIADKVNKAKEDSSKGESDSLIDGLLTPSEIGGKVGELFGSGDSSKSSSSGYEKDPSYNGNSADRSVYDRAFAEKHESGDLTEVEMCRVVDGDTLVVCLEGSYTYVRLIGINTPESVASDEYLEKTGKENTQEGRDASAHSKELLHDVKTVWLEFDAEEYDPYERILAYVWTSTDKTDLMNMVNARILADGLAEPMSIKPNTRYAAEFSALVDDGK
jgi:endonuclease YncB( thermonuclease family)